MRVVDTPIGLDSPIRRCKFWTIQSRKEKLPCRFFTTAIFPRLHPQGRRRNDRAARRPQRSVRRRADLPRRLVPLLQRPARRLRAPQRQARRGSASRSSPSRSTTSRRRRRSPPNTTSAFPSATAPTPTRSPRRRAPTSIESRTICRRPVSCWRPSGAIVTAVYSSGAIGRLVPDDVAGFVSYLKSKMREIDRGQVTREVR